MIVCVATAAACGGGTASGPHGWEGAPAPTPEEEIAEAVLTELAGTAVRGYEPVGLPVGGELKQGAMFAQQMRWTPGTCYAAVGGALGAIEDLQVWIVASGPKVWPGKVVAASSGHGNLAIAGGRDECFLATDDLPTGGVIVKSVNGDGFAAVQLYMREPPGETSTGAAAAAP